MIKKIKIILMSLLVATFALVFVNVKVDRVKAANQQFVDFIKALVESGQYNQLVAQEIKKYISEFNIPAQEFDERISANSQYRILEVTPRSYLNSVNEVTDMKASMDYIKDIFETLIRQNPQYANMPIVANMKNFSFDTMTIKEFVSNREEIAGLYDGIVFTGGSYTNANVEACDFTLANRTTYSVISYENGILRYVGGSTTKTTNFKNIVPHGFGVLYHPNSAITMYVGSFNLGLYHGEGAVLIDKNGVPLYVGGYKNGKRSCYGVSYENGITKYVGQWANDKYHGYGILFNGGLVEYIGYFNNGQKATNGLNEKILDDLTILKADEVIEDFVKKGIPVFIHEDALSSPSSNIYNKLQPLINQYDNLYRYDYEIKNVNNNIDINLLSAIMEVTMLQSQRPNFQVVNKPVEYKDNDNNTLKNSDVYKKDDVISFTINLTNKDSALLKFYLDINQNGIFEDNELAHTYTITRGNNNFSYILQELYSGQVRYKIEVGSGTYKSIYTNSFRYHSGDKKTIKVVNVINPVDKKKPVADLQTALNNILKEAGLNRINEYEVQIKVCTLKNFKNNNTKHDCAHAAVMNDADVVLLGRDIFDNTIHKHALESIQTQIDIYNKPVIFTSSVTLGDNHWMSYFHDDLSLSTVQTSNYKLTNRVDKLHIINQNPYVLYPYDINEENLNIPSGLNYALNEKYQLNLENPSLTNFINMYNSQDITYDRFDSYNNYYYMKNNNVIYLNVGYDTYNNYTNIEQKLLANAIVNGYIEYKSQDRNVTDFLEIAISDTSHQNALVDYNDIKDTGISFTFTPLSNMLEDVNYVLKAGSAVVETGTLPIGQAKTFTITNLPKPANNTIDETTIYLTINNSKKQKTYSFNLYIADLDNYGVSLDSNQLIGSVTSGTNKYLEVNKTYKNQYIIRFGNIDVSNVGGALPETLTLSNMKLTQSIPVGVSITTQAYKNNVVNNILTIDLGNITYRLDGDYYVPVGGQNRTITLEFDVLNPGTMNFGAPTLTFNGIGSDKATLMNSSASFKALYPITGRVHPIFEGTLFIPFGQSINLGNMFIIDDYVEFNQPTFTSLDTKFHINQDNRISALEVGEGQFRFEVTDIFGYKVNLTFNVRSYETITRLDINAISLYVNDVYDLILPVNHRSIFYKFISGNPDLVEITGDSNFYRIKGLERGYAEFKFYGYDTLGNVVETSVTILVDEKYDIRFIQKELILFINETYTRAELNSIMEILNPNYTPDQVTLEAYNNDKEIVTINSDGSITANKLGKVVIEAKLPNDHKAQLVVKVYDSLSDESGFVPNIETTKFYQSFHINLIKYLVIIPDIIDINDLTITFEIINISDPRLAYLNGHTLYTSELIDEEGNKYDGTVDLRVNITQVDRNGNVITVIDDATIIIRKLLDPTKDKGDNAS